MQHGLKLTKSTICIRTANWATLTYSTADCWFNFIRFTIISRFQKSYTRKIQCNASICCKRVVNNHCVLLELLLWH